MTVHPPLFIRQLDLELFGGCNYDCDMCPQKDGGREADFKKSIPFDVFKKIVDDACQYGLEAVSLHGSGEPTLYKRLPEAIAYCKSKNLKVTCFTNGYALTESLSKKIIDAGLDILRISAIGYDEESYLKWMSKPAFELVRNNARIFNQLSKGKTELHLYHLITEKSNIDYEISAYKTNWVEYTGAKSEIWLMHNWAGTYNDTPYTRINFTNNQRSCGRMFKPMLQVRAGGLDGHYGAVVACCMVLGRDSEAVLGHLDTETLDEIWHGTAYEELRRKHLEQQWNDISYCRGCDQLYDYPESLVWTNIENRLYGQSKILTDLIINK